MGNKGDYLKMVMTDEKREELKKYKTEFKKINIPAKLFWRMEEKKIGTWEQFLTRLFCFWENRGSP